MGFTEVKKVRLPQEDEASWATEYSLIATTGNGTSSKLGGLAKKIGDAAAALLKALGDKLQVNVIGQTLRARRLLAP